MPIIPQQEIWSRKSFFCDGLFSSGTGKDPPCYGLDPSTLPFFKFTISSVVISKKYSVLQKILKQWLSRKEKNRSLSSKDPSCYGLDPSILPFLFHLTNVVVNKEEFSSRDLQKLLKQRVYPKEWHRFLSSNFLSCSPGIFTPNPPTPRLRVEVLYHSARLGRDSSHGFNLCLVCLKLF